MATFGLLRSALRQLALNPDEQRRELAGTCVTDELALDLENAVSSLAYAQEAERQTLPESLVTALTALLATLDAAPDDEVWDESALDHHVVWTAARTEARSLLDQLPPDDQLPGATCRHSLRVRCPGGRG